MSPSRLSPASGLTTAVATIAVAASLLTAADLERADRQVAPSDTLDEVDLALRGGGPTKGPAPTAPNDRVGHPTATIEAPGLGSTRSVRQIVAGCCAVGPGPEPSTTDGDAESEASSGTLGATIP